MTKIPRSCGTHDGTFHADEVTACALLSLFDLIDVDKIMRTRDPKILNRCEYVCDVGAVYDSSLKLFDHHQVDYDGPLSSAGMVLLYLKDSQKITGADFDFFNKSLIRGVDAHDNGCDVSPPGVCTYSHIISNYMPISHESSAEARSHAFMEAFHFARDHLDRLWRRRCYVQSCRSIVAEMMRQQEEFLLFDRSIPWMECFFELNGENHPAKFVVMPSGQHWKLRGIPPSLDKNMLVRIPLPLSWAGMLDDDFKRVTGISGAIFCHKGRFISVWETCQDAMAALNYVLKNEREEL